MGSKPKISVLMSVYNGEKYLKEAVDSILNQTFSDFEFIVINDHSTDSTSEILFSYKDSRLKIIENDENIGITKSLNKGLRLVSGKYTARMDADDISFNNRLEKQLQYLEDNPDVGVLGTMAISNGKYLKYKINLPSKDYLIKWQLFFSNPIIHPECYVSYKIGFRNRWL
jgi:glycosyltransferase involved in cell wall biosynthesis